MSSSHKKLLVLNLLSWLIAALLHPVLSIIPTGSGETPKFYSFLIPMFMIALAAYTTWMFASALGQPKQAQ